MTKGAAIVNSSSMDSRRLHILLFICFASFVLLGCLSGCKPKKEGKIKITIWHQDRIDIRLVLESQLQKFMKLHPEVEVEQLFKETESLRSGFIISAIAGQGPEIVYGPADQVGPFQVMDIILPLEDLFDRAYLDQFDPKALTYYKGHLYQIADKLGNHLTLVYNKKLVPKPPTTEKELIAIGEHLTQDLNGDGKPDRYGLAWNYTEPFFFIPFMTGFGGWIMDDSGKPALNNPGTVDGLKFIKDLRDKYKIIPNESDYEISDLLFKDGKVGMIINGDWSWSGYEKAGIDFGVAPLPKISKTGLWCGTMVSPKGFSLNANISEEKKKWAIELIKFLTSDENELEAATILHTMPTKRSVLASSFVKNNDIMKNSEIAIDHGRPMPVVPELRAIWDAMRPSYQAVLGGYKTAEQAAADMQLDALNKIKEMNE